MRYDIYKWMKNMDIEKADVLCVQTICVVLSFNIFFLFFGIYDYLSVFLFSFFFLCIGFSAYFLIKNWSGLTKYDRVALLICLFFSLLTGLFHHTTLWGAYDSGVYSFSAIHYASNGSFFIKEVDWPFNLFYQGFIEKEPNIFTQVGLPGYSVFLSIFYKVGGLEAMFWANMILIFFTTLTLYLTGKEIANHRMGLIFITLFSLHYTTLWFTRRTLSENLTILLIWASIFLFISGVKRKNGDYLIMSFVPLTLGLLVRFEVLLYLITFLIVVTFLYIYSEKYQKLSFEFSKKTLLFSFLLVVNIFNLIYYYLSVSNYYINYYLTAMLDIGLRVLRLAPTQYQIPIDYPTYEDYILKFVFDSFNAYLLIPLLIFIIFGIKNRKYNYYFILLAVLTSSSFLLIVHPGTSWTHPWFMRHYWVVLVPFLLLMIAIGIETIQNKNVKIFSIFTVVTLFISIGSPIFALAEEKNVPRQFEEIHNTIKDINSIIIVDQADHKVAEPLYFIYGYKALPSTNYEFNITAASKELNFLDSPNIYILSRYSDTSKSDYDILPRFKFYSDDELELIGRTIYPIKNLVREREADKYARPGEFWPPKKLDEGYEPIKRSIEKLPLTKIRRYNRTLYIYRVENVN